MKFEDVLSFFIYFGVIGGVISIVATDHDGAGVQADTMNFPSRLMYPGMVQG